MLDIEQQLRRHAEWVRPQLPPLRAPDEIGAVVEPARRTQRPRPGRLAWTAVAAAAAAVIVVAAAVGVGSQRSAPPAGSSRPTGPQTVTTGPDSALVPPSTVGDLQLWSLTATSTAAQRGDTSTSNGTGVLRHDDGSFQQIFGRNGHPTVEISARRPLPNEGRTGSSPGLMQVSTPIRGGGGRLESRSFAPGQSAENGGGHLTPMALIWNEGGLAFTATFRNLSPSQARTFVDSLQVSRGGIANGFVAPTAATLGPLALPQPSDISPTGLIVQASYATGPDASSELSVTTCPAGAGGCTPSYADIWIWGTRLADGSVEGAMSYGGGSPEMYARVWPDGQGVEVSTYAADPLDVDLARQIADHVVLGDRAQVVALQDEVSTRLLSLPRVAAAAFDLGAVEVHAAGHITAVCLAPAGQSMSCTSATYSDPATPPTGAFTGGLVVDGRWFVAAARQGTGPFGYYPDTPDIGAGVLPQPIAGRSAQGLPAADGWELGLVQVPDSLGNIVVTHSGPGSIAGAGVARPAS